MKLLLIITIILTSLNNFNYSQSMSSKKQEEYISTATEIVNSALRERKGYYLLQELCEIGPRLSGSENSYKAIDWAEKKMREMGFDVWLQPVMVPYWVRGNVEEAVIKSSSEFNGKNLVISALGRSIGTPPEGITAGVIELKNFEEIEEKKDRLKDKIVFISDSLDETYTYTFSGYSKAVKKRSQGHLEAGKYGAAAVLIRSITTKHDNNPHVGAMWNYVDSIPKIPAAAVGYLDSDSLSMALKKDPNLKLTLRLSCETLPDTLSYNVIADLKGSEYPDEVVVVAGHFDSWDKGCGAHDDGAGCIQALEVLDLMNRVGLKPKRTLRAIFYMNEENGIKGAKEYAAYADTTHEKHVAAIESDRGVFTPRGFTVKVDTATAERDSLTIEKLLSWLPILRKAEVDRIYEGGGGVDIEQIKNAGALIGYLPDTQRYMDLHHSDNDVFEAVHPREMELGSAAMAILAYLISEEGL